MSISFRFFFFYCINNIIPLESNPVTTKNVTTTTCTTIGAFKLYREIVSNSDIAIVLYLQYSNTHPKFNVNNAIINQ